MIEHMFENLESVCRSVHAVMRSTALTASTLGPSQDTERLTAVALAIETIRRSADAAQLAVFAELARRGHERGPDGLLRETRGPEGEIAEMATDEIAFSLGVSDHEARTRSELALGLAGPLAPLLPSLLDGAVSERTVRLVADETSGAAPQAVAAVVAHVLEPKRGTDVPRIEALDRHDLAQACRRVLDRSDPGWREAKARTNRAERTDVRSYPGDLGTTEVVATLPSEIAQVMMSAVTEHARALQRDQPELRAGPARAQALADLALRGVEVSTHVTLGLSLVHGPPSSPLGLVPDGGNDDQTPWTGGIEIPRIGWIPGSVVQTITERLDTRVTRALLDPDEGTVLETSVTGYVPPPSLKRLVRLRGTRCRMFGCERSAAACDLDHATPYPAGETSGHNLGPLCRHHHRVKHSPGWAYALREDGVAEWTSPAGTSRLTWPTEHAPVATSSPADVVQEGCGQAAATEPPTTEPPTTEPSTAELSTTGSSTVAALVAAISEPPF